MVESKIECSSDTHRESRLLTGGRLFQSILTPNKKRLKFHNKSGKTFSTALTHRSKEISRSAALENNFVPLWDVFFLLLLFSISLFNSSSTFRFHLRRLAHMERERTKKHPSRCECTSEIGREAERRKKSLIVPLTLKVRNSSLSISPSSLQHSLFKVVNTSHAYQALAEHLEEKVL